MIITHELVGALDRIEWTLNDAMKEFYDMSHSGGDPDDPNHMSDGAVEYRQCKQALRDIQAIRDAVPEDLKNAMDDHCYYGQIKAYEAEYYEAAQILHAVTQEQSDK